jgi:hypothetical protein
VETARYDITIHQGATFELPVQYNDSTGAPVNMNGYTVAAQLWNRVGTVKISNFAFSWTAQASGIFNLRLASTVTSGITEQGQYDVLVTEPNGDKYYLLQGTAFIDLGLTGR